MFAMPVALRSILSSSVTSSDNASREHQRMDLHSGPPHWLVRNGLGPDYARLTNDLRT